MSDDLEDFLLLLSKTPPTPTPRITTNGGSRTSNVPSSILADLELEEEPDVKVRRNSDLFLLSMMHRDKDEEEPVRNCYDPPKSTVLGTLDRQAPTAGINGGWDALGRPRRASLGLGDVEMESLEPQRYTLAPLSFPSPRAVGGGDTAVIPMGQLLEAPLLGAYDDEPFTPTIPAPQHFKNVSELVTVISQFLPIDPTYGSGCRLAMASVNHKWREAILYESFHKDYQAGVYWAPTVAALRAAAPGANVLRKGGEFDQWATLPFADILVYMTYLLLYIFFNFFNLAVGVLLLYIPLGVATLFVLVGIILNGVSKTVPIWKHHPPRDTFYPVGMGRMIFCVSMIVDLILFAGVTSFASNDAFIGLDSVVAESGTPWYRTPIPGTNNGSFQYNCRDWEQRLNTFIEFQDPGHWIPVGTVSLPGGDRALERRKPGLDLLKFVYVGNKGFPILPLDEVRHSSSSGPASSNNATASYLSFSARDYSASFPNEIRDYAEEYTGAWVTGKRLLSATGGPVPVHYSPSPCITPTVLIEPSTLAGDVGGLFRAGVRYYVGWEYYDRAQGINANMVLTSNFLDEQYQARYGGIPLIKGVISVTRGEIDFYLTIFVLLLIARLLAPYLLLARHQYRVDSCRAAVIESNVIRMRKRDWRESVEPFAVPEPEQAAIIIQNFWRLHDKGAHTDSTFSKTQIKQSYVAWLLWSYEPRRRRLQNFEKPKRKPPTERMKALAEARKKVAKKRAEMSEETKFKGRLQRFYDTYRLDLTDADQKAEIGAKITEFRSCDGDDWNEQRLILATFRKLRAEYGPEPSHVVGETSSEEDDNDDGDPSEDVQQKRKLIRFYKHHDKTRLDKVDAIIAKFGQAGGKGYEKMWARLMRFYKVSDPSPSSSTEKKGSEADVQRARLVKFYAGKNIKKDDAAIDKVIRNWGTSSGKYVEMWKQLTKKYGPEKDPAEAGLSPLSVPPSAGGAKKAAPTSTNCGKKRFQKRLLRFYTAYRLDLSDAEHKDEAAVKADELGACSTRAQKLVFIHTTMKKLQAEFGPEPFYAGGDTSSESEDEGEEPQDSEQAHHKKRLIRFYKKYDPSRVSLADTIVSKYGQLEGGYDRMWDTLAKKFGPEPPPSPTSKSAAPPTAGGSSPGE